MIELEIPEGLCFFGSSYVSLHSSFYLDSISFESIFNKDCIHIKDYRDLLCKFLKIIAFSFEEGVTNEFYNIFKNIGVSARPVFCFYFDGIDEIENARWNDELTCMFFGVLKAFTEQLGGFVDIYRGTCAISTDTKIEDIRRAYHIPINCLNIE